MSGPGGGSPPAGLSFGRPRTYPVPRFRRVGRAVEGAPLLREYGSKAHRGFESLTLRQIPQRGPSGPFRTSGPRGFRDSNPRYENDGSTGGAQRHRNAAAQRRRPEGRPAQPGVILTLRQIPQRGPSGPFRTSGPRGFRDSNPRYRTMVRPLAPCGASMPEGGRRSRPSPPYSLYSPATRSARRCSHFDCGGIPSVRVQEGAGRPRSRRGQSRGRDSGAWVTSRHWRWFSHGPMRDSTRSRVLGSRPAKGSSSRTTGRS